MDLGMFLGTNIWYFAWKASGFLVPTSLTSANMIGNTTRCNPIHDLPYTTWNLAWNQETGLKDGRCCHKCGFQVGVWAVNYIWFIVLSKCVCPKMMVKPPKPVTSFPH